MPAYDAAHFEPPAPLATATATALGRAVADVPMLLDTGADVSTVPRGVAEALGVRVEPGVLRLQAFDGSQTRADVAAPSLQVDRYRFSGQFVVTDADHGILGRNILNALALLLDGPRAEWRIVEP